MFMHFWTNEYMNHMCEGGAGEEKLGAIFSLADIPTASCQGAGLRFVVTTFTGVTPPPPPSPPPNLPQNHLIWGP